MGSCRRPLSSRVRRTLWLRASAMSAGMAQMPDRSTCPRVPGAPVPEVREARVSASVGARSPAPASSGPSPAQEAGTPVSVAEEDVGEGDAGEEGAGAAVAAPPRPGRAVARGAAASADAAVRRRAAGWRGGAAFGMGRPVRTVPGRAVADSSRCTAAASAPSRTPGAEVQGAAVQRAGGPGEPSGVSGGMVAIPGETGTVAAGGSARAWRRPGRWGVSHSVVSEGGLEPPRPIKGTSTSS